MRKAQIIETVNTARGRVPSQHPRPPPFASRQIFHEERKVSQCQEPPSKKFWRETQKWLKNSTSCRHPVSTVNTGWSWETSLLKPGIAQDLRRKKPGDFAVLIRKSSRPSGVPGGSHLPSAVSTVSKIRTANSWNLCCEMKWGLSIRRRTITSCGRRFRWG